MTNWLLLRGTSHKKRKRINNDLLAELIRSLVQTSINHSHYWFKRLSILAVPEEATGGLTNHPRLPMMTIISRAQVVMRDCNSPECSGPQNMEEANKRDGTSFVTGWIVICTSCSSSSSLHRGTCASAVAVNPINSTHVPSCGPSRRLIDNGCRSDWKCH